MKRVLSELAVCILLMVVAVPAALLFICMFSWTLAHAANRRIWLWIEE